MHSSFQHPKWDQPLVTSDPRLIIQRDTGEYLAVCQAAPHTVKTSYLDWLMNIESRLGHTP